MNINSKDITVTYKKSNRKIMKNNLLNTVGFALTVAFMIITCVLSFMKAIPVQDAIQIWMLGILITIISDKK